AAEDVVAEIGKVRRAFDVSTAAQVAAVASLGDDAELRRRRDECGRERERVVEILTSAGFDVAAPAVANFVYADTGTDARAVFDALLHEGVTVRPLLDRLSRRRLMIASDLLRAGVFVALPFVDRPEWIVVLAAVSGLGNAIYRPTVNAAMPNLLEENELERGNALFQTVENMAWAAGPIVGGAIVAVSGTDTAYWINAGSFIFSAAVIRLIPSRRLQSEAPISKGHWRDIADGLAFARRSPTLQVMLVVWSIEMIAVGCVNVGEIVIAKDSFNAGDFGYGLLFGASGVGLAIG